VDDHLNKLEVGVDEKIEKVDDHLNKLGEGIEQKIEKVDDHLSAHRPLPFT
jgi:hypothetical protein